MATIITHDVRLAGVSAAVPSISNGVEEYYDTFGRAECDSIAANIGVSARRIAPANVCASDLGFAAASKLLEALDWSPSSVDALVVVTQTPDHILPATSCLLHDRLGLATHCLAFDIGLGCSGYVYGLAVLSQLMSGGSIRRAVLVACDTVSRLTSPGDRSVAMLFGDAGTATALEFCSVGSPIHFELGTAGSGAQHIIVPAGGFRYPRKADSVTCTDASGNARSENDLCLSGPDVFTFTLRHVPKLLASVMSSAGWIPAQVDFVIPHQANAFMLKKIARKTPVLAAKWVMALDGFGNTSSASIPLAMVSAIRERLSAAPARLLLAGFGVGFSWAGAAIECDAMVVPELVEV